MVDASTEFFCRRYYQLNVVPEVPFGTIISSLALLGRNRIVYVIVVE